MRTVLHSPGRRLSHFGRTMAEFTAVQRRVEDQRKRRIENAVNGTLCEYSEVQRCLQCSAEYVPADEIGARNCRLHQLQVNSGSCALDTSPDKREWMGHYRCCGVHGPGERCVETMRSAYRYGCRSADHSTRFRSDPPIYLPLEPLEVDLGDENGLAAYVHIEPLFLMRKIALARGLNLDYEQDRHQFFGTCQYRIIDSATSISAHRRERITIRAGVLNLSIDVRDAYVGIAQRYRLPHSVIGQNFIKRGRNKDEAVSADTERRRQLDALLASAFSSVSSGDMEEKGTRTGDVILLDVAGAIQNIDSSSNSPASTFDAYYDVHAIVGGGVSQRAESERDRASVTSAEHMVRNMINSIAPSKDNLTFYPFVVWTWVS